MQFYETKLKGSFVIEIDRLEDERGFFARSFCKDEFRAHGLCEVFVQCNVSFNKKRGTLRGMHYQISPFEEAKLIRCTRGAIYDVVLDLRSESPTFREWVGVELTADSYRMVYIPQGCAHGLQTFVNDTEVFYQMSEFYHPECARGVRWNDPQFGIIWPLEISIISERDNSLLLFEKC